jgi:virginiamycin B lyase
MSENAGAQPPDGFGTRLAVRVTMFASFRDRRPVLLLLIAPVLGVLQLGCGSNPATLADSGAGDSGIDPRITLFPTAPGNGAWMIAAGPDGNLWFTERGNGLTDVHKIARITLSGEITEFPLPDGSQPWWITSGPDGAMWFTDYTARMIGRITTGGTIKEFPLPTARAHPIGITRGSDGNLWFTESTSITNADPTGNIGRITPEGVVTEFPVDTQPQEIATGPDGNIWYVAWYHTAVARLTPDGKTMEFPLPQGSFPHGLVAGPDGNIWVAEALGVGRLSLDGVHTAFDLPAGGGANEFGQITPGPDGALWFATESAGIGRATIDGTVSVVPLPGFSPVTGIAVASDGSVWLTDGWNDNIVRFRP